MKLQSGNTKFDQNRRFFCPVRPWNLTDDIEKQYGPLLCYVKLSASFHGHLWIQNGVTVRKRSIWVKIGDIFVPCDLEMWRMTLKNNRAPLLCYSKRYASFDSHLWIQNGVTVRKRQIWVKIGDVLSCVTLKFDGWPWKTTGHLFYAISSFALHFIAIREFKNGVTVRKRQIWVKIGDFLSYVTLTFDLWPWPFAWTSRRSMVITPENFRMIRWQEHCRKGVTDGQTDGRTVISVLRAACQWSQLKMSVRKMVCLPKRDLGLGFIRNFEILLKHMFLTKFLTHVLWLACGLLTNMYFSKYICNDNNENYSSRGWPGVDI